MGKSRQKEFIFILFRYSFNFGCLCTAFGMSVLWLYRFLLDEDSVKIDLKPFTLFDGQYPMLSFCHEDPFIESKLKEFNNTLSGKQYREFLKGEKYYNEIKDINFDDVTLNMADFYLGDRIQFKNGSYIESIAPNFNHEKPQVTFTGFWGSLFYKCFSLRTNLRDYNWLHFMFNSSMYPNGIRPHLGFPIVVIPHLPNQLTVSGPNAEWVWKERNKKQEHQKDFAVRNMEILKRRNKKNDPCILDNLNFDQTIVNDHMDMVGCKAPYQRGNKGFKTCDSKEKMAEASADLIGKTKPKKACTSIASIGFVTQETDINSKGSDWFHVVLVLPDQYKEIVMVKAVDIETVIANAGGYIGLFLGKKDNTLS